MTHAIKLLKRTIKAFNEERMKHKERVIQNRRNKARIIKTIRESNLPPTKQSEQIHQLRESRFTKLKRRLRR